MKFIPDARSNDSTRERIQTIISLNTKSNPRTSTKSVFLQISKRSRKLSLNTITAQQTKRSWISFTRNTKFPKHSDLQENRQGSTKPRSHRFKLDNGLKRKVWVRRRPDVKGRDKVASIDVERLFRNKKRNRWGRTYIGVSEPIASTNAERKKQGLKCVSSTKQSDVMWPTANFNVVDLKEYYFAKTTKQYIQISFVMEKSEIENSDIRNS